MSKFSAERIIFWDNKRTLSHCIQMSYKSATRQSAVSDRFFCGRSAPPPFATEKPEKSQEEKVGLIVSASETGLFTASGAKSLEGGRVD